MSQHAHPPGATQLHSNLITPTLTFGRGQTGENSPCYLNYQYRERTLDRQTVTSSRNAPVSDLPTIHSLNPRNADGKASWGLASSVDVGAFRSTQGRCLLRVFRRWYELFILRDIGSLVLSTPRIHAIVWSASSYACSRVAEQKLLYVDSSICLL